MPPLGLVTTAVRRSIGGMPQLPIKNFYVESAVTEPTQFVLMGRPGLTDGIFSYTRGTGPINAAFQQEGVLSNAVVLLSDDDLYVGSTNKGSVPGTDYASIAGTEVGVIATRGDDMKFVDSGGVFRSVSFPDGQKILKVLAGGSRFVAIPVESQKYYWTEPLFNAIVASNLVFNPLDFASAENLPDYIRDALIWRGYLILAGGDSIEFHAYVGDDNLPWVPQVGMVIAEGVAQLGCMTTWNDTFAWISPSAVVYSYNGSGKQRISDPGIEELIAASTEPVWMDSFTLFGHEFLRITGPADGDLFLDAQTMQWAQWATEDGPFLGGHVYGSGLFVAFGSKTDGHVWVMSFDYSTSLDAGNAADRIFRAGIPVDGGVGTVKNVMLRCSGGLNDDATIQMRYSRDKGNTWSNWKDGSLGSESDYRTKVEWRNLGMVDQPGFLAEFKIPGTDAGGAVGSNIFSVSGAYYNEFVRGRGR